MNFLEDFLLLCGMLIIFKLSNENKYGIHGWFCSAVTCQKKGAALVWAGILWSQVESGELLPNVMAQQSIRGQQSTRDRKKRDKRGFGFGSRLDSGSEQNRNIAGDQLWEGFGDPRKLVWIELLGF